MPNSELNQANIKNVDTTSQKENFKLWLATIPSLREPKTQEELALCLGVHSVTLSKWKTTQFMDEVVGLIRSNARNHTIEIINALVQKARDGSFQHIQLFLNYIEKWYPDENEGQQDKEQWDMQRIYQEVLKGVREDLSINNRQG